MTPRVCRVALPATRKINLGGLSLCTDWVLAVAVSGILGLRIGIKVLFENLTSRLLVTAQRLSCVHSNRALRPRENAEYALTAYSFDQPTNPGLDGRVQVSHILVSLRDLYCLNTQRTGIVGLRRVPCEVHSI